MFSRKRERSNLELATDSAFRKLSDQEIGSEEYQKILDQAIKLHKMKEEEKPDSVSKDTLALIAGNLLGIILIIRYEHVNVITSRAINFVLKPRT